MADPFRSSAAPQTPAPLASKTQWTVSSTRSPLTQHGYSTIPPPRTPTPSHERGYDKVFEELEAVLQEAKTVVSFEWKPSKCQGKFVPIP